MCCAHWLWNMEWAMVGSGLVLSPSAEMGHGADLDLEIGPHAHADLAGEEACGVMK